MIIEQLTESLTLKENELTKQIDSLRKAQSNDDEIQKVQRDLAQVKEAIQLIS